MRPAKILIRIIAAGLLLGCLSKMPYGYYQLMRWIVCAGFVYLAYTEYKLKRNLLLIVCGLAAVLFNPLKPIYFKKETWHPIDIAIAIALLIWVAIDLLSLMYNKRKLQNRATVTNR